jgi:carbon-monoxide dehydrogenase catalytic subunit
MPPILHCGSCVDNSRLLIAATEMVREGGLGDDLSDLPLAGTAPLWMSEKAVAIGQYFVSSGVYVIFQNLPFTGSKNFTKFMTEGMDETYGGCWDIEADPLKLAQKMIARIDLKRKELGIDKKRERVLFDMEMRRDLGTGGPLKDVGCHGPTPA